MPPLADLSSVSFPSGSQRHIVEVCAVKLDSIQPALATAHVSFCSSSLSAKSCVTSGQLKTAWLPNKRTEIAIARPCEGM